MNGRPPSRDFVSGHELLKCSIRGQQLHHADAAFGRNRVGHRRLHLLHDLNEENVEGVEEIELVDVVSIIVAIVHTFAIC